MGSTLARGSFVWVLAALVCRSISPVAGWAMAPAYPRVTGETRGGPHSEILCCGVGRRGGHSLISLAPRLRPAILMRGTSSGAGNGMSGDEGGGEGAWKEEYLEGEEVMEEEAPPLEYVGIERPRDDMEFGIQIENIGLEIMVGPSSTGAGRGLFVALNPGVDRTVLPKGTPIGGYSKRGTWERESSGDKCVAYAFSGLEVGVFFEKELVSLLEAVSMVEGDVHECVSGHSVVFDEEEGSLHIEVSTEEGGRGRYFVPDTTVDIGVGNVGMFANDVAYTGGCTEEEYDGATARMSVLELAWRMEDNGGILVPTWPVVILSRNVAFANSQPMEVGVNYGWKYWEETRKRNEVGDLD